MYGVLKYYRGKNQKKRECSAQIGEILVKNRFQRRRKVERMGVKKFYLTSTNCLPLVPLSFLL